MYVLRFTLKRGREEVSSIPREQVVYKEEHEPEDVELETEDVEHKKERRPVRERGEDISLPYNPRQVNDIDW